MRYFKTTNALRPYRIEGRSFEFDRLRLIGGLFHGVAALEDSDFASALADYGKPVSEIKEDEYYSLKKKAPPVRQSFSNSENQPKIPPSKASKKAAASAAKAKQEPESEPESPDELFSTGDIEISDHLDSDTK